MVSGPPSPEYFVTSKRSTGWAIHGNLSSRASRVSVLETCNTPAPPETLHDVDGTSLLPPPRPCRARGLLLSPPFRSVMAAATGSGQARVHCSGGQRHPRWKPSGERVDVSCFNQTALAWNDMIRGPVAQVHQHPCTGTAAGVHEIRSDFVLCTWRAVPFPSPNRPLFVAVATLNRN